MIFAYQVAQVGIFLLQVCISVCFYFLIAHLCWQVVFSTCLLDKALFCFLIAHIAFHLHQQLLAHAVQWLNATFVVQFHKVPTKACWERLAHFAGLHVKGDVFEWLYHHASAKPAQIATAHGTTFVVGVGGCYFGKVCTCQYYLI